ncbi:MAG: hypothetical protein K6E10_07175 [Eubacterium sp.]|nr:hypothetical protein [Eubacterium sp.]
MGIEKYQDIIDKERPQHNGDDFDIRHPRMSREQRAKIFAPFAALKGFEEASQQTAKKHTNNILNDN